ncbi:MAG: NAD(P)/FAD-dependent oxidoreductase [Legionella sp.]|nr:NAD(P)/FAD-dependent oxidoreductase [Legionella sp.]
MNQASSTLQRDVESTIIVGAGISGLALALLLGRQGRRIALYDKRTLFGQQKDGRSINFTISGRGLSVLEKLGLKDKVLAHSTAMVGRMVHLPKAPAVRYKYGTKKAQVLLSIRRTTLVDILLNEVALEPNIQLYCGLELMDINIPTLTCHFLNSTNQQIVLAKADCIIGADGIFSAVRSIMLKSQITSYQQTVFNWGYKEYQFDGEDSDRLQLSTDNMHMWPKSNTLMVAIPNTDSSFSVIFTAPLKSQEGQFHHFDDLVKREYPNLLNAAPSFLKNCGQNPYNLLVSVKVDKWYLEDKIVLLGDACHATYPFYGQGMNSALEDAVLLSNYFHDKTLSRQEAFIAYEKIRKSDTDALHRLSEAHLQQMTKAMVSPYWQARDILDFKLAKLFSKRWVYEYEMVAHSTASYSAILEIVKKQNKKKRMTGFYFIAFMLGLIIQLKKAINAQPMRIINTALFKPRIP